MINEEIIKVDGLWKRYGLLSALRKGSGIFFRQQENISNWALRDVNFSLHKGEMLGVIGRNGAGKSTLLKILAGISPATRGKPSLQGRVFPMIELNAGIHPELTGRENIYLLGAIMGLSKAELRHVMPEIIDFCELGSWFDRAVRKYSAGMLARLGFAVAANIKADILLIDEVLAAGDTVFQRKCINWLNQARQEGVTILFVSHSLNYIERLCSKALYLENGVVQAFGETKEVCARYYKNINDAIIQRLATQSRLNTIFKAGTKEVRVVGIKVLDTKGKETRQVFYQSDLHIQLEIEVYEDIENPCFTVVIIDQDMNPVGHVTTLGDSSLYRHFSSGKRFKVDCKLKNISLLRGVYTVDVVIANQNLAYKIDVVSNLAQFEVVYSDDKLTAAGAGHFIFPAEWYIEYITPGEARDTND